MAKTRVQVPVQGASLVECFSDLPDPRMARTREHALVDIVVIAICAVVCGAEGWTDVEAFGVARRGWFKRFLALPNGIPSHDTFGRVFARLSPSAFEAAFGRWMTTVTKRLGNEVVAIDGKTLRRSFDLAAAQAPIHMVSAWASHHRLVLGQVSTDVKSNEITAIPEPLELLDISGCIVTIDAMGCQTAIAADIVDRGADYALALKGNHDHLHHDVRHTFAYLRERNFEGRGHGYHETTEKGHGRIEFRRYWTLPVPEWMAKEYHAWKGLSSLGMVESERHVGQQVSRETRYYLLSFASDAERFAQAARGHWGIENQVHWVLDMVFREDECRIRTDHAPANFSVLRRIAMNLLRQENSMKGSVRAKRLKAGWDLRYLYKVLNARKI